MNTAIVPISQNWQRLNEAILNEILKVYFWGSLVAQTVKNLPAKQETRVQSLGWEDPLEKEMATHSSILAWRIPWTEEPGQLQSTGSQTFENDWSNRACTDAPRLGYALFERGKEVCLFPTTSARLKFSTEISIPHTYSWSSRNTCR